MAVSVQGLADKSVKVGVGGGRTPEVSSASLEMPRSAVGSACLGLTI